MKSKLKKTLISSVPYAFIALFATKLGQTWRLADGITVSKKFLHIADGFTEAAKASSVNPNIIQKHKINEIAFFIRFIQSSPCLYFSTGNFVIFPFTYA